MSRGLKNRTPISNAVNTELYEQLKKLSKETMIPMSRLLDRGIELVLEEYKKPTSK
jgi:predicted DNA-binding protein